MMLAFISTLLKGLHFIKHNYEIEKSYFLLFFQMIIVLSDLISSFLSDN
jgi:hypothetical protein